MFLLLFLIGVKFPFERWVILYGLLKMLIQPKKIQYGNQIGHIEKGKVDYFETLWSYDTICRKKLSLHNLAYGSALSAWSKSPPKSYFLMSVLDSMGFVPPYHRAFVGPKFFLVRISWVSNFSRGYFVGLKFFSWVFCGFKIS